MKLSDAGAPLVYSSRGCNKLGWTDGRNLHIDYRFGGGNADTVRKHAARTDRTSRRMSYWGLGFRPRTVLIQATQNHTNRICELVPRSQLARGLSKACRSQGAMLLGLCSSSTV